MEFEAQVTPLVDAYVAQHLAALCAKLKATTSDEARDTFIAAHEATGAKTLPNLPWVLQEKAIKALPSKVIGIVKEARNRGVYAINNWVTPYLVSGDDNAHVRDIAAQALEVCLGLKTKLHRLGYGTETLIFTEFVDDAWRAKAKADTPSYVISDRLRQAEYKLNSLEERIDQAQELLMTADDATTALDQEIADLKEWYAENKAAEEAKRKAEEEEEKRLEKEARAAQRQKKKARKA